MLICKVRTGLTICKRYQTLEEKKIIFRIYFSHLDIVHHKTISWDFAENFKSISTDSEPFKFRDPVPVPHVQDRKRVNHRAPSDYGPRWSFNLALLLNKYFWNCIEINSFLNHWYDYPYSWLFFCKYLRKIKLKAN